MPLANLDIVKAFASQMMQAGEEPIVRLLWDNHYRINYYKHSENRIGRSLFVTLVGGKVQLATETKKAAAVGTPERTDP